MGKWACAVKPFHSKVGHLDIWKWLTINLCQTLGLKIHTHRLSEKMSTNVKGSNMAFGLSRLKPLLRGPKVTTGKNSYVLKRQIFVMTLIWKCIFLLLSLSLHAARRMGESMQNRISIRIELLFCLGKEGGSIKTDISLLMTWKEL